MTVRQLYDKYAQECYDYSSGNGFWEERKTRNKSEMIMLMINELSECQEAHRSGKHNPEFITFEEQRLSDYYNDKNIYAEWYKDQIKGCTGEELADVVIRIFDYVVGWEYSFVEELFPEFHWGMISDNFSEGLFSITINIIVSSQDNVWQVPVFMLMKFAEKWGIDLQWHIEHKQKFNRTREYKHGKKY